jgi:YVTN family beta-propeller protein
MRVSGIVVSCLALSVVVSCSRGTESRTPVEAPPPPAQSQVVATIPVGPNPAGILATAGAVYIANNNQTGPSSVGMLLPKAGTEYLSAYQQTPDIDGPPSSFAGTYDLTLSRDGKTLFALNSGISAVGTTISLLDTTTHQFKGSIGGINGPDAMVILPDGKTAYVANYGFYDYKTVNVSKVDSRLSVVDLESGKVRSHIAVQRGPDSLILSADARTLYCANVYDNSVSVIDTTTNTVTATLTDTSLLGPFTMALTPDGKFLHIANYGNPLFPARTDNNTVTVIDTATNAVAKVIPGVGSSPSGIAITPNGKFAFVTSYASQGTVAVIDIAAGAVIQTLSVGTLPSEVAIDPAGTYAYVTNFRDNTVSVIRIPR